MQFQHQPAGDGRGFGKAHGHTLADAKPLTEAEMPPKAPRGAPLGKEGALVADLLKLLLKIRAKEAGVAPRLIVRADDLELLAAGQRHGLEPQVAGGRLEVRAARELLLSAIDDEMNGRLRAASWEEALGVVAAKLNAAPADRIGVVERPASGEAELRGLLRFEGELGQSHSGDDGRQSRALKSSIQARCDAVSGP